MSETGKKKSVVDRVVDGIVSGIISGEFQPGSKLLREHGIRVESLAVIDHVEDGKIFFK